MLFRCSKRRTQFSLLRVFGRYGFITDWIHKKTGTTSVLRIFWSNGVAVLYDPDFQVKIQFTEMKWSAFKIYKNVLKPLQLEVTQKGCVSLKTYGKIENLWLELCNWSFMRRSVTKVGYGVKMSSRVLRRAKVDCEGYIQVDAVNGDGIVHLVLERANWTTEGNQYELKLKNPVTKSGEVWKKKT